MHDLRSEPSTATTELFWSLWLRERPLLLRRCARWLQGHHQEAEDILSTGALKALSYLHTRTLEAATFRAWALRIVSNLCTDRLRAGGLARARFIVVDVDGDAAPAVAQDEAHAQERALLRAELRWLLDDAVDALPPRLRVTFDQRVLEDLSYDEIALSQRITSANARKRVQQAREQLRRRLAGPTGRALIESARARAAGA